MLLAIDIGNTNIHVGLWDGKTWINTWRMRTIPNKMADEYAVLLRSFLGSFTAIDRVGISSVVPVLNGTFAEVSRQYMEVDPLIVSHRVKLGIALAVEHPEQVGADRIVNSVATHALYKVPAIVVDFGTATTFDVVGADGSYLGGSIAPGIGIARDALVGRIAQLYQVAIEPPVSPIGRNTTQALQSGLFWGYVGLVEGLVTRLRSTMISTLDSAPVTVIATGGLALLFQSHTTVIDLIAPLLTLDGIRLLSDLNPPAHA